MGFWSKLFGKRKAQPSSAAQAEAHALMVDALIKTMAFVASSDGSLDDAEISKIAEVYRDVMGSTVDTALIRAAVTVAQQDTKSLVVFLEDAASKLGADQTRKIVEGAIKVAAANGVLDSAETLLIDHVASSLGFSRAEAKQMIAAAR